MGRVGGGMRRGAGWWGVVVLVQEASHGYGILSLLEILGVQRRVAEKKEKEFSVIVWLL